MSDLETMLARYAEDIRTRRRLLPEEFCTRCQRLRDRGLSARLAVDLGATDNAALLRDIEALSDDQLRTLSEADDVRRAALEAIAP